LGSFDNLINGSGVAGTFAALTSGVGLSAAAFVADQAANIAARGETIFIQGRYPGVNGAVSIQALVTPIGGQALMDYMPAALAANAANPSGFYIDVAPSSVPARLPITTLGEGSLVIREGGPPNTTGTAYLILRVIARTIDNIPVLYRLITCRYPNDGNSPASDATQLQLWA
jgi:hypothetical protein